jgi:hypothetical protein
VSSALHEWETFYVIVGSSAAALTGLQFVVVALMSEGKAIGGEQEVSAFGTPTVVHFCIVLLIGAICSVPGQTPSTLAACLTITAVVALAYIIWVIVQARRQTGYKPVFEDWLFHAILPFIAYGVLLASGITARANTAALYFVAGSALLLLYVGIHNAWDTAVFIATARKKEPPGSD